MLPDLRVHFMVVLALLAGVADAQPGSGALGQSIAGVVRSTPNSTLISGLTDTLGRSTAPQMRGSMGGVGPKIPLPQLGKVVKYGGGWLLAGNLVMDGIQWCVDSRRCRDTVEDWLEGRLGGDDTWNYPKTYVVGSTPDNRDILAGANNVCDHSTGFYVVYGPAPRVTGSWWPGQYVTAKYNKFTGDLLSAEVGGSIPSDCGSSNRTYDPFDSLSDSDKNDIVEALKDYIELYPDKTRPYFDKKPNDNQWDDSPYSDRSLDTDGDGFTDADEYERGSDLNDPDSTPDNPGDDDTDSDGDGYTDEEERKSGSNPNDRRSTPRDRDGDGFDNDSEESAGSDPDDPSSTPDSEEPDKPCPDGMTRPAEGEACERPRDPTQGDPSSFPPLEPPQEFETESLHDHWSSVLQTVRDEASTKFPFGIGDKWFPRDSSGTSFCSSYSVEVGDMPVTMAPCSTEAAEFGRDVVRPALVWLLFAFTGLAAVRISLS